MNNDNRQTTPLTHSSSRFVKKYLLVTFLAAGAILLSVTILFNLRAAALIHQQLLEQARALFEEIVITRQWIAGHGGVYVPLTDSGGVNPYLEKIPGLKVVIQDRDETEYTLKNPALVTREISGLASEKELFSFHITSLKVLNPANRPDPFEAAALKEFENGITESYHLEDRGNTPRFRYIAPLMVNEACLRCHGDQGYEVGDIRGGISIILPAGQVNKRIERQRLDGLLAAVGILLLFMLLVGIISRYLLKNIDRAEKQLYEMATRDFLTGLLSRREGLRRFAEETAKSNRLGIPLSCLLLDIDHFKVINDTHGHLAGDQALKAFSDLLHNYLREYDIVCRYGGEEFLVVLPGIDTEQAVEIGQRVKLAVEGNLLIREDLRLSLTVSIGLASHRLSEGVETMISRADQALYRAKETGRNRVCSLEPDNAQCQ